MLSRLLKIFQCNVFLKVHHLLPTWGRLLLWPEPREGDGEEKRQEKQSVPFLVETLAVHRQLKVFVE